MKACNNCKYFWYEPPQMDQPYPEFACTKGHWDGTDRPEELLEEIDCKDFTLKQQHINQ